MLKRILTLLLFSIAMFDAHAQDCSPSSARSGAATASATAQSCQPSDPSVPPTVNLSYTPTKSSLVAPGYIMLTANAEAYDATVASIAFYNGSALLTSVAGASATFVWQDVPAGTYSLTAVATDSRGIWNTSAPLTLTVAGNAAPTVSMVANLTVANAPGTIDLSATASDSDGSISKVDFFNGTTLLETKTQAPYVYTWLNVPAGTYSLTARATDNLGGVTTTSPSIVTVTGGGPQIYYVYADQINTAREITNSAGVLVWRADTTEPFGANLPNENPSNLGTFTFNPRFPGQYLDNETGLHYNYFRDYDPSTGRYVQSDPIGLRGGVNTYGYVFSQPLRAIDPKGLQAFPGETPPRPAPLPGPFDVFIPGTQANRDFANSLNRIINKLFPKEKPDEGGHVCKLLMEVLHDDTCPGRYDLTCTYICEDGTSFYINLNPWKSPHCPDYWVNPK